MFALSIDFNSCNIRMHGTRICREKRENLVIPTVYDIAFAM